MPEFKPEDMAARQADRIKETCKIDDEQYKKVLDIFLKEAKEQQEMMKKMQAGEQPNFDPESFQKRREAQTKALKEILNEEQFAKYEKEQQEMRERMMQGGGVGVTQMVPAGVGGVGNNIEGVGLGVEEAVGACELEVVDALALKGEEHGIAETVVLVHVEIHIAFVEGIVGEDGVGAAAEGVDVEQQFGKSERGWVAEPVLAILPIEVCAIISGVVPVARPERDGHGVAR